MLRKGHRPILKILSENGSHIFMYKVVNLGYIREDVKIPTYKPHTNHKRSSVSSHTLAPTTICDLSNSLCWRPLTDLGHISSVTYICHPLWFVCGHRKGILTSPLIVLHGKNMIQMFYFNDIKPVYIHFHTWQIHVHIPRSQVDYGRTWLKSLHNQK